MTTEEKIKVMQHYVDGGEIEVKAEYYKAWSASTVEPSWNWFDCHYRIKEYKYPMWFKSKDTGRIIRFDGLNSGEDTSSKKYSKYWESHTNKHIWQQIDEPIQELTLEQVCKELGRDIKIVKG